MQRRPLDFDRPEQIMPDVDRLLASHATAGGWTLGAICDHLARSINLTLRAGRLVADPAAPTPEQDLARREFFRSRTVPAGRPLPTPRLDPDPNIDPRASADALRDALGRLASHPGPFPAHPYLGPLTRDEWLRFHCIHCAHHLSFALPA